MSRREFPADPHTLRARNLYAWTEMEALQRAAPHEEPVIARKEIQWIREQIEETAQTTLSPRELWIFNAIVIERLSMRAVGRQLGLSKTHVWRIYHRAIRSLRRALWEVWPDGPPGIGRNS